MTRRGRYFFDRVRGDRKPFEITVRDEDGQAVDISGWTFRLTMDEREEPDDTSTRAMQIVGTIQDPLTGTVLFSPSADDVDRVGVLWFDIEYDRFGQPAPWETLIKSRARFTQGIG